MRDAAHDRMFTSWISVPFFIWTALSLIAIVTYVSVTIRSAIAAWNGQHYKAPFVIRLFE